MVAIGAVAFTKLQGQVSAMGHREEVLREEIKETSEILLDVQKRVIKIEKDIEFIKERTK